MAVLNKILKPSLVKELEIFFNYAGSGTLSSPWNNY